MVIKNRSGRPFVRIIEDLGFGGRYTRWLQPRMIKKHGKPHKMLRVPMTDYMIAQGKPELAHEYAHHLIDIAVLNNIRLTNYKIMSILGSRNESWTQAAEVLAWTIGREFAKGPIRNVVNSLRDYRLDENTSLAMMALAKFHLELTKDGIWNTLNLVRFQLHNHGGIL